MSDANFSNDATSVVEAIQNSVKTEIINLGDKEFTTRPVFAAPVEADTRSLAISTLDGLVEYVNENVDSHNFTDLVIVVRSPRIVSVLRQIESRKDARVEWLTAEYDVQSFPFERFIDHEQFMVAAQALLWETDERAELLKFVGNLTTARIQTSTDDGVSQTVVVEAGVRKSEIELPNPVNLAPVRTFAEVEQPHSPFVLRVRQSREGQMPEIALFEADGGLWRIDAISNIKKYIKANLAADAGIPVIG